MGLDSCLVSQVRSLYDPEILQASEIHLNGQLSSNVTYIQLRRRLESERSFSFSSADNIHSVAMLLKVSHCNHCECVHFLSSFLIHHLALLLGSSRTIVYALFERL
jgi:hypothetical protein